MSSVRVVVVDDDHWKRSAMARELDADPRVEVVAVVDQDSAVRWPASEWNGVDVAVVDVFDELAPAEIGTDVFSGITALEHLARLGVRTLAVTPHCQHPLVQLRIHEAGTNHLYHRWEVNSPELLLEAVLSPDDAHRPVRPSDDDLSRSGAELVSANRLVRLYSASPLYGLLRPEIGQKSLPVGYWPLKRFKESVLAAGFWGGADPAGADPHRKLPRWVPTRDLLLRLLGRLDVPPTEVDRDDWLAPHRPPDQLD